MQCAEQLAFEFERDSSGASSLMSHFDSMQHFETLPDGWMLDRTWGSPKCGWQPVCNGKSMISGGKNGLLRVDQSVASGVGAIVAAPPMPQPVPPPFKKVDLTEGERKEAARATNDLARARFKEHILKELSVDLMVCKIEGWSIVDYISDLKNLIDEAASSILRNNK